MHFCAAIWELNFKLEFWSRSPSQRSGNQNCDKEDCDQRLDAYPFSQCRSPAKSRLPFVRLHRVTQSFYQAIGSVYSTSPPKPASTAEPILLCQHGLGLTLTEPLSTAAVRAARRGWGKRVLQRNLPLRSGRNRGETKDGDVPGRPSRLVEDQEQNVFAGGGKARIVDAESRRWRDSLRLNFLNLHFREDADPDGAEA